MTIHHERLTVARDEGFVVFLIGMRVNKWWQAPAVWGVASGMAGMLRELGEDPDAGFLGYESYLGQTSLMVQYWRSHADLQRYSHAKDRRHMAGWRRWVKKEWNNGAVGIWHETYVIEPGNYECVYDHMPAFGLGKVGPLVPATGALKTAAGRMAAGGQRVRVG